MSKTPSMKKVLSFLIFFISVNSLFGQIKFDVKFSQLYATYDFLTKISENYPDNTFKSEFTKSNFYSDKTKNQIKQFENLRIDYSYFYNQYPQYLKSGLMSRSIIERNLATSKNISEFIEKSLGIIPNEDLTTFSQILQYFIPIYEQIIFNPNEENFKKQKLSLSQFVDNNKFNLFFEKGLTFYGTEWNKDVPFEIIVIPSLEKNNLDARAFINVAICEPSFGLKDYNTLFSVTMHEIYHIIYDNQPLTLKNNLQNWFNNTNSKNSQYALLLLNEVLATDLGNAYIMENLNYKINEEDWYANFYITSMAKELYPLVKNYLESNKTIDENFVKEYVKIYDTKFSNWNKDLNHILAYRYILADNENDLRFFRRNFRKYSYHRSGMPISSGEIEKLKEQKLTKVIVISKNNKENLQMLKDNFLELKNIKFNDKKEFIEAIDLADKTKMIIINRTKSTTEELIKKYFPENKIK